jgi:hypothetical protein
LWIFTTHGFYSVEEDEFDSEVLVVRSRVEGDLEKHWPFAEVEETPANDYRYRARIWRRDVAAEIAKSILEIDYSNFKDSITDDRRSLPYLRVWSTMAEMQEMLRPRKP